MKLQEILLVTENKKGTEINYLSSFADYLEQVIKPCSNSTKDMATMMEKLYSTKEQKGWADIYVTANKTFHARFCGGESELRGFLLGQFHEPNSKVSEISFDEERCTKECLDVLPVYGLKPDGHSLFNSLHYEPVEHTFHRGEVIPNFNGTDYRVLAVLSPKNLLLMSETDNQLVVGVGVLFFERSPKEHLDIQDDTIQGVEWQNGVYLGNDITRIDFDLLTQKYGEPEKIETVSDLRSSLDQDFRRYENISENTALTDRVRKAASESLYQLYSTDKREEFDLMLSKGMYDGMLAPQTKKTEKTR